MNKISTPQTSTPAWAETFNGTAFDLICPQPDMVDIQDIAEALAKQCRFNGHTQAFYSVAQHSVMVSQIVEDAGYSPDTRDGRLVILYALLHDAKEAYIGDITTPMKLAIAHYSFEAKETLCSLEKSIDTAIFTAFDIPKSIYHKAQPITEAADLIALATEKRDLLSDKGPEWQGLPTTSLHRIAPMTWERSRAAFLERFRQLTRWSENADGISYCI